jgi:acyl dehydratase
VAQPAASAPAQVRAPLKAHGGKRSGSTRASVKDIYEHGGRGFYVFETVSVNERGETVCTGTWTDIVRTA